MKKELTCSFTATINSTLDGLLYGFYKGTPFSILKHTKMDMKNNKITYVFPAKYSNRICKMILTFGENV